MRVSRHIGTKMRNNNQMKYFLYIAIIISLLVGCSGTKEVNQATTNEQFEEVDNPKEKAMEHFLNGSIAEQEGDYLTAVLEYQNALKYDKSGGIYYALAKSYLANNKLSNALQSIRLADHRLAYLDYEGPLSGNRGSVRCVDRGTYDVVKECSERLVVELQGSILSGSVTLLQQGSSWEIG